MQSKSMAGGRPQELPPSSVPISALDLEPLFFTSLPGWEEKIPLAKTSLEKTWLFHEIGRCYLELNQPWEAQEYGEKSQAFAEEEGDIEWQLNASVLVAQAQVKLKDYEAAVRNFEKALERAKLVHNNEAQNAIISALDDANKGIIEELRTTATVTHDNIKDKKDKEEIYVDPELGENEKKEKGDVDDPRQNVKVTENVNVTENVKKEKKKKKKQRKKRGLIGGKDVEGEDGEELEEEEQDEEEEEEEDEVREEETEGGNAE